MLSIIFISHHVSVTYRKAPYYCDQLVVVCAIPPSFLSD